MLVSSGMNHVTMGPVVAPGIATYTKSAFPLPEPSKIDEAIVKGIRQIFLAGDLFPYILIFVGIAVCSRITAFA